MTMKPKTQRQAEKQVEKKKLSETLRKNLMRRKVLEKPQSLIETNKSE